MHLAPRVQAAQLEARATSEPTPKRRQKEPKTEGERERSGIGRICNFAKKGQRDDDSCERTFASCHERTSVFARPAGDFTMGDWQQMTEEGRSAKD